MNQERNKTESDPFVQVTNDQFPKIRTLLKSRLPISGHVYNMALSLETFPKEMRCFTLNGDLSEKSIVLIIFDREDYNQDINMSIPKEFKVTDEIRQSFISTSRINWQGKHLFVSTDRRISYMIFEISTKVYRNSVIFNPNYCYFIPTELTTFSPPVNGVRVDDLKEEEGLKFLTENWKYARPGAVEYLRKIIKCHLTAGVYKDGELVCAAIVNGHGLIGVLNTAKQHRNNGYATMCMKYLFHKMSQRGMAVVSTSQQENSYSVLLHEKKLGMSLINETDYIFHIPYLEN